MPQKIVAVIEDDVNLQELFVRFLQKAQFEVVSTGSGREAIDLIDDIMPDLLVLDMKLPEVHGSEIIHYVRENNHLKHIKILIVSSEETAPASEIAELADMALTKPVSKQQLTQIVGDMVGV